MAVKILISNFLTFGIVYSVGFHLEIDIFIFSFKRIIINSGCYGCKVCRSIAPGVKD